MAQDPTGMKGAAQVANSPQSRYVSQMYKQAKDVEQAYSTWNMLRKQGRRVCPARRFGASWASRGGNDNAA